MVHALNVGPPILQEEVLQAGGVGWDGVARGASPVPIEDGEHLVVGHGPELRSSGCASDPEGMVLHHVGLLIFLSPDLKNRKRGGFVFKLINPFPWKPLDTHSRCKSPTEAKLNDRSPPAPRSNDARARTHRAASVKPTCLPI